MIEAAHYAETRDRLTRDPVIQAMAEEINVAAFIRHEITVDHLRSWDFTIQANREYTRRGGTISGHIGGPAQAVRALLLIAEKV